MGIKNEFRKWFMDLDGDTQLEVYKETGASAYDDFEPPVHDIDQLRNIMHTASDKDLKRAMDIYGEDQDGTN